MRLKPSFHTQDAGRLRGKCRFGFLWWSVSPVGGSSGVSTSLSLNIWILKDLLDESILTPHLMDSLTLNWLWTSSNSFDCMALLVRPKIWSQNKSVRDQCPNENWYSPFSPSGLFCFIAKHNQKWWNISYKRYFHSSHVWIQQLMIWLILFL